MLTYPTLNGRPVDKWMVTELKDELRQRNLPITGLKDDLVRRLFEAIQDEENTDGGTLPAEGLKGGETPGSVDVSVYEASGEADVDEGVSEVMKQGEDVVISVTESINESLVPTTEAIHEAVISTVETGQRTLNDDTEVAFSLVDKAATDENCCKSDGVGLELASGAIHNDIIEKTPEYDSNGKMFVDGTPSENSVISTKLDVDRKILETCQAAVISPAEATQGTMDAVTEVECSIVYMAASDENHCQSNGVRLDSSGVNTVKEVNPDSQCHYDTIEEAPVDESSMKMAVVDVSSDVSDISIKLGVDVDRKVLEATQDAFIGTAEASQRALDAVNEVGASLVDMASKATNENQCETDGVGLEFASVGNTTVKKVNPHSEVCEDTIEKNPEDKSSKKMVDDDVPSDITSINIKLGVGDVDMRLLEQEAVPTPPDAIVLYADNKDADADAVAAAVAVSEDDTDKEMAIDDVSSDVIQLNVNSGIDVDCKIEQEVLPTVGVDYNIGLGKVQPPPDAIALHAHVAATADSMILKNSFSENAMINGKDYGDPKSTNGDRKLIESGPEDKVSEVNQDLESQIKCVSNFHDNVSTNEKNNVMGNLNANNSDFDLEAKQEIMKPVFTIPSIGDCLQVLDGDEELHKNGSMEESRFTCNMDLDTKEDSPDGNSTDKRLDLSPSDDSMGEDLMGNVHDFGGKTKVTSEPEHVFKEVAPVDTIIEGSSGHAMEAVAEDKPPNPTEKRKSGGHEVIANGEHIKRKCRCDVDTVNTSDQQASKLTSTGIPDVIQSSIKHSFGQSNSTLNGDPPKERIVPPPQKPVTTSLRIDGFVRPFTLKAAQNLLGKTGSISSFWMDHIKTHCYVTYSSVEEAVATRNAVCNLQWPPNNGSCLIAEFVDPQEVKLKLEPLPRPPVPLSPSTATAPCQLSKANQTIPPHAAATSRGMLPTPAPLVKLHPASDPATAREMLPPPPDKLEPSRKLEDLFKKTKAYPRIYYMPLSQEEALAKFEARGSTRRNP